MDNNIYLYGYDYDSYDFDLSNKFNFIEDDISNIFINKGFMAIINIDAFDGIFDELCEPRDNNYLYEYDRLYRKKYKYEYVIFISGDLPSYKNVHSSLQFLTRTVDFKLDIDYYYERCNSKDEKNTNIKNSNITKLKKFVDKQNDYFSSIEVMNKFNVSNKWVKRYMGYMNKKYHNIGYSYSMKKWYKVL